MISRQENSKETVDSKMKLCADVLTNDIPAIERVCKELSEDERKNGVKYFEVSLNPYILLGDDKSDEKVQEVVSAVLSALAAAQEATGVRYGVVLQYSKGMKDEAKFLLSLCKDLKDENVVGIELAGYDFNIEEVISDDSENVDFLLFSPDDIDIFMEAKDNKIHRSVHAGAYCPSEVIFQAIEKLGAERIVFGYSVIEDNSLYQDCISNKIHFCTTPSFNYGPKGKGYIFPKCLPEVLFPDLFRGRQTVSPHGAVCGGRCELQHQHRLPGRHGHGHGGGDRPRQVLGPHRDPPHQGGVQLGTQCLHGGQEEEGAPEGVKKGDGYNVFWQLQNSGLIFRLSVWRTRWSWRL